MNMTHQLEEYLDIDQLAELTQLSPATLWRLKKAGKISFCQPGGKGHSVRFPLNAIEQAMNLGESQDSKPNQQLSGPIPKWKK
jgi:predicted DNA-binding transcriptional regulator AlpA